MAMAPDEKKRRKGIIQSVCVTTSYILFGTICVILNRLFATDFHFLRPYASTLLAVQIKIFDLFWQKIGPWLASHEEHTDLLALVQSQSLKYSIFLTFNTFQGFIWIAYVQPHIANEACKHAPQCFRVLLRESISQSFPILILFSGLGMAFPFYQIWQKYKKQAKDMKILEEKNKDKGFTNYQISSFEEQTKKMEYTGEDAMYDYTQVLSSLSFVALFGSVNPLPIVGLAWLAITVQHRVDAIRLCVLYQRTYPDKIANIGVWDKMLSFLRYACVANIIGLLSSNPRVNLAELLGILPASVSHMAHREDHNLTLDESIIHQEGHNLTLDDLQESSERLLWLGKQFAIVLLFFVMMFIVWLSDKVIPDESAIVTREKARQRHQRAKLFDFENSEFSEDVKIKGTGNHELDRYESVSKLEPHDERYIEPITMC